MQRKDKASLLLETMISLSLLGVVIVSIVASTVNISNSWQKLKGTTDSYDTIYSTYQILRGLNSTNWLDDHLNTNILSQFKSKYDNENFKLNFSNISSIVVKGFEPKTIQGNDGTIKYYTYYTITYTLKYPSNKTIKLPLTINYLNFLKIGE